MCRTLDLVYPNLVTIKRRSGCGTCGLLNLSKSKMIEEVTRNCVRIVRHIRIKEAGVNEVGLHMLHRITLYD